MAGTVRINVTPPTPSVFTDGSPMTIDYVRIDARVDGAQSWTPDVGRIPAGETTIDFPDTPAGRWNFRGVVVPTQGDPSAPLNGAPVDVPFGQASPLEAIEVTLAP